MSLCQVDSQFVWIACQDGSIAVCDISTRSITKYSSFDELVKDSQLVKCMRTVGDRIVVLAYHHGMLAFIENESLPTFEPPSSLLMSINLMMPDRRSSIVIKYLENIECLNTIEIIGDNQQFIWCGCDKGIIYIVESDANSWEENLQYHNLSNVKLSPLNVASFSDKLDAKGDIVQLKSTFNSALGKTIVYGLHKLSEKTMISCWQTDQTLHSVICLNEQGNVRNRHIIHNLIAVLLFILVVTIFPWSDGIFVVGDKYKIKKLNANDGDVITKLPGYHREVPVYLTSMHAVMSPSGFLSSIGQSVDMTGGTNVPCHVLISVGTGCKGPLQNYSQLSDSKVDNTYALLHVIN